MCTFVCLCVFVRFVCAFVCVCVCKRAILNIGKNGVYSLRTNKE